MIERYRNNNPRTRSEIAAEIEETLQTIYPDAPVIRGTQNYAFIQMVAATLANNQEQSLSALYNAGYLTDATGEELTKKAREIGVRRNPATEATGIVRFSRDSPATSEYLIPSGTVVGTGGDDNVRFETIEATTIGVDETVADAAIQCTVAGPVGNVGANTITVLVSGSVSGVDSVSNPQPTGDPLYTLTDDETSQTAGKQRESDTSLRDRALDSTAIGGAGTADATELAIENIPEVNSATVYTNRSDTVTNGIDPWHTEIRVFGGSTRTIAERLYEVLPVITLETLQGGVNGTKDSVTLNNSPLYGDITISITRPSKLTLDISIDVVHTTAYAGRDAVADAIVNYVGGTTSDSETVVGRVQDENVLINEIEGVAERVTGVEFADVTLVDTNGDGSDDTTTDADGVPVISVGASEVAQTAASDITVTETAR